ncbi:MAG: NAD(+) diphosphatase [Hyphomicrobiales bacterium]
MANEILHSFAGGTLNRAALERPQEGYVESQLARGDAKVVTFAQDRVLVDTSAPASLYYTAPGALENAGPLPEILLGIDDEKRPVFAQFTPVDDEGKPTATLPDTVKAIDLRSLAAQALLPAEELGLLAYARSLSNWHSTHRFCANCGEPTEMRGGGDRRSCTTCSREHYPRTDPVAIILIYKGDKCLLGRGRHFDEKRYSALAGFIETGESIEEAARREIFEEAGVKVGRIIYHSSQPWPFVSTLMIGLMGEAENTTITMDEEELEDVRWFSREEARQMLDDTHPDGFTAPPALAIAHHLLKSFVDS